jgi:UDP-N-acetylglucosamine 1-carboxyvinyltransferase
MDKFIMTGGKKLSGSIRIDGSKNAVLPMMTAALLIEKGTTVIKGVPNLADVHTAVDVLTHLGARCDYDPQVRQLSINAEDVDRYDVPYDLMRRMRASFLVLGALIGRFGKAKISLPGGCSLGPRPVDLHIKGLQMLGVRFVEEGGYIIAAAPRLTGSTVYFDRPTHTGTENLLSAAAVASGKTILINAAADPEVVDVANFLVAAGAKISGAGTPQIKITGVKRLKAVEYTVLPDRLEAGTFMMAAAITGGYVELTHVQPDDLDAVMIKLREMDVVIETTKSKISVRGPARLTATDVTTFPYPGFPTDVQAGMMALLSVAAGTSRVVETVFPQRFAHAMELGRMGADIRLAGGEATVTGVKRLKAASVMASDIRAGAGLVLAALAAQGCSEILRVYHIDRGYHRIEQKLSQLGADIQRVSV